MTDHSWPWSVKMTDHSVNLIINTNICVCVCVALLISVRRNVFSIAFGCSSEERCHMDFRCAEHECCLLDSIESHPFWYLVVLSYHCLNYLTAINYHCLNYLNYLKSIGTCVLSTYQYKVRCWPIPSHQSQKRGTCSKLHVCRIKSSICWYLGAVSRYS